MTCRTALSGQPPVMIEFPPSVRHCANRIDPGYEHTDDVEGYVFDGVDGSQVAFWTCHGERESSPHTHPFDEYLVVVAGRYVVTLLGGEVELGPGDELVIGRGIEHGGRAIAGTRTIHHFAGRRADRTGSTAR